MISPLAFDELSPQLLTKSKTQSDKGAQLYSVRKGCLQAKNGLNRIHQKTNEKSTHRITEMYTQVDNA